MSGETEASVSGWTTDTLHQHLSQRLADVDRMLSRRMDDADKAIAAALVSAEKAVATAASANEKRFECVESSVLILCSDLAWRPAGELRPGDELIACDEQSPTRRGRRFRRSVVTANSLAQDALLRVTTSAGSVRCNAEHPWLARRDSTCKPGRSDWLWVRTDELRSGDSVLHSLDTWETDGSWQAGWLAGMYDGEGCLTCDANKRSQLSLAQRESATSLDIERVLKTYTDAVCVHRREAARNRQPVYHYIVTRLPDVLRILGTVRPPRLLAKADSAWEGKPLSGWHRAATVASVESDGTGTIARLSTSTHTYIGDGFIMHNSVNEFRKALSDQTATFIPRAEYDTAHIALVDRVNANADRLAALELRLTSRLDRGEGSDAGAADTRTEQRLNTSQIIAAIATLAAVISLILYVTKK